ncbi:putative uncharacterized protein DDB_G0290521 [Procambarus clarkii]|uniref:putative uncharacterized protein DDB_G0290521 n=1 Tax=Procambarus clarkii TaxID=6728 RepID=UPI0037448B51
MGTQALQQRHITNIMLLDQSHIHRLLQNIQQAQLDPQDHLNPERSTTHTQHRAPSEEPQDTPNPTLPPGETSAPPVRAAPTPPGSTTRRTPEDGCTGTLTSSKEETPRDEASPGTNNTIHVLVSSFATSVPTPHSTPCTPPDPAFEGGEELREEWRQELLPKPNHPKPRSSSRGEPPAMRPIPQSTLPARDRRTQRNHRRHSTVNSRWRRHCTSTRNTAELTIRRHETHTIPSLGKRTGSSTRAALRPHTKRG